MNRKEREIILNATDIIRILNKKKNGVKIASKIKDNCLHILRILRDITPKVALMRLSHRSLSVPQLEVPSYLLGVLSQIICVPTEPGAV